MKKIFAIVLTTIIALVTLVGCSGGGNSITVAVPNDATNEARALLLLQEKGYITLKEGAGITAVSYTHLQPEFALESLCLSVIIDAFSSDGECTQTTAELN